MNPIWRFYLVSLVVEIEREIYVLIQIGLLHKKAYLRIKILVPFRFCLLLY